MRRWLLIGGTLFVLALLFAAFLWGQRGARLATAARPLTPATRPSAAATQLGSIGGAEGAWVTTNDKRTGLRQARLRGQQFIPQQGDQVFVQKPQVEFFIGKLREETLRIEGDTGLIIWPGGGPRIRADLSATPTQTPSRGSMRNVRITYYPSEQAVADDTPELTVTMNNAYFDSELYEIATEQYVDAAGNKIAADEVPIVLRGETFDFDGKGLTIRWDERSQKLKSMVINKGERLVLKKSLQQFGRPGQTPKTSVPLRGVHLAAADNRAALQAADSALSREEIYRATFHDDVVITQDDKRLASGNVMHVDFLEPQGSTLPATRVNQAKQPPASPQHSAETVSTGKSPAQPAAAEEGIMGVTRDRPIVVRWAGQMVVKAAPEESLHPESPHDAVIWLSGSDVEPVRLYSTRGSIEGALAAYQVQKEFALVEGSEGHPVRMVDAKGSILTTPQLRYWRAEGKAVLRGPSTAELVEHHKGRAQTVDASWQDLAEATFSGSTGESAISKLVLQGDVKVEHPRLQRFNSRSLTLDFEPGGGKGADAARIRQITATGGVDCVVSNEKRPAQTIRAENLKLFMSRDAAGDDYPSRVEADGSVFAGDDTEQIQADAIQADLLAPEKNQPTVVGAQGFELAGLEHLLAAGKVQVKTAKGETVSGDRLQVRQSKDQNSWVVLEGKPATVVQEGSALSGGFIEIDTATQKAIVTGGGKLAMADAKMSSSSGGFPMELTWTGDGNVDGSKDVATVQGNVLMRYNDGETMNEASGDRLEIALAPKPGVTSRQKKQFAFMSDRVAQQVTLLPRGGGDVNVQSILPAPDGTILRQINLFAPRLECRLATVQTQEDGSTSQRRSISEVHAPADAQHPGRLLYITMPPATRQSVKVQDPLKSSGISGATAFSWTRELVYDRAKSQVVMEGDMQVRHNPVLPGAKSFSIAGQKIVADVVTEKGATPAAGSAVEGVDVRKLTLTGSPVRLERDDTELAAPTVTIDPAGSMVHATSSGDTPVQVERGRMIGAFDAVDMNTRTNEMNFSGARGTGRK